MAPLEAAYPARCGVPTSPETEVRLTIEPPPRFCMPGARAAINRRGARTFTASCWSIISTVSSPSGTRNAMAALLTSTSISPTAWTASRASRAGASGSDRSVTRTTGSCPSPEATASRCDRLRAARTTRAPAAVESASGCGADASRSAGDQSLAPVEGERVHRPDPMTQATQPPERVGAQSRSDPQTRGGGWGSRTRG